jgi:hypothetical protein
MFFKSEALSKIHIKLVSYPEELLAPRPTPKPEDQNLSAVCDFLFNIFTVFSIHKPRMSHVVVTETHIKLH